MILSNSIDKARRLTNTSENEYENDDAVEDANDWLAEANIIINQQVSMRRNWDYWKTDTVIWQSEYKAEQFRVSESPDIFVDVTHITSVLVLVDWEYKRAIKRPETEESDQELEETTELQYSIRDNSVFIFPTPTEVITNWIKLEGQILPNDITLSDEITVPRQFKTWLEFYLMACALRQRRQTSEAELYETKAEKKLTDALKGLKRSKEIVYKKA